MNPKDTISLSGAILILFSMLLFILFSENGLADLNILKSERDRLSIENKRLELGNLQLYRTIDRLKNDPHFIEGIARRELGMVREGEIILQVQASQRSAAAKTKPSGKSQSP